MSHHVQRSLQCREVFSVPRQFATSCPFKLSHWFVTSVPFKLPQQFVTPQLLSSFLTSLPHQCPSSFLINCHRGPLHTFQQHLCTFCSLEFFTWMSPTSCSNQMFHFWFSFFVRRGEMVLFLRGIVSDRSLLPDGIQRISSHFFLTKTNLLKVYI